MVKKSKRKSGKQPIDPHFEREAEKYDNPIPSREYILTYLNQRDGAPTRQDIEAALKLTTPDRMEALRRRLRAMERDGQILRNRRGQYRIVQKMDLIRGRVLGRKDGYGVIIPDEASDKGEEYILNAREMRQVFHEDRVLACKEGKDSRGRIMVRIVEVLARNTKHIVGRFHQESGVSFVIPDNTRITHSVLILPNDDLNAKPGQIVTVEITMQPSKRNQPMGKIIEVLGDHMAPGMEIDVALRSHAIPHDWSAEVLREVKKWQSAKQLPKKALEDRVDCRELPLVTIDGEDAKDFDDAVFAEPRSRGGWRLYVAIADVSYYVEPGSALDKEAQTRGTSVYFPSEVIPMLPEVLSNGWCSLQPEVDRLAMVCEMNIAADGKLTRYEFYQAVIRSHARLTYTQVATMLQGKNPRASLRYKSLLPHLHDLHALYKVLHRAREQRGAIDFELTETQVIFGRDRKIEKVVPRVRNDAHRMIEEAMLMANVATARLLKKHNIPALYRIHESPGPDKVEDFKMFLHELGVSFNSDGKTPGDFSRLLKHCYQRDDYHLIQTVMLRTMCQAVYSPDNIGHFGLAFPAYTHFTSPIRRYPDLITHRLIRHLVYGASEKSTRYTFAALLNIGESCSSCERRADDATRDVLKWLKCEYMLDKVGMEFDGIISGVTAFGLFVELKDIYVDGLVHVTSLENDYFRYDAVKHRLRGERTGQVYQLGDKLRVQVTRVDLDERSIDFDLPKTATPSKAKNKSKKKSNKRRG